MAVKIPRLVIAGLSGDSGKTIVSLSLTAAMVRKGLSVSVFKKGPDYIDAAWLGYISGGVCRNLDTFMVDPSDVFKTFAVNASQSDMAVVEGNRGIFDGRDVSGTHSTAGLAGLLQAPVILVVNTTKTTRTIAALVKGCIDFAPQIKIAGVILNRVAGKRHHETIAGAIEKYCQLPVLGSIPKLGDDASLIPGRHLGLTTPSEFEHGPELLDKLNEIAGKYLDLDELFNIANHAGAIEIPPMSEKKSAESNVNIGYFRDSVFTFYYPENLEALERNGAKLVPISSLDDSELPDIIDGLYIGGGFPETQAERLSKNRTMLDSVKKAAEKGMPIYAECGGLIYLSKSIIWNVNNYPMAGVFSINLKMNRKPAGHGYCECVIDVDNPFFKTGLAIRGHEFHYSNPVSDDEESESCISVLVGSGLGNKRDGLIYKNTMACYTHIHADGVRNWAPIFIEKAQKYKKGRGNKTAGGLRIAV